MRWKDVCKWSWRTLLRGVCRLAKDLRSLLPKQQFCDTLNASQIAIKAMDLAVKYLPSLDFNHSADTIKEHWKLVILCTKAIGLLGIERFWTILNGKVDSWYPKSWWEPNRKRAKSVLTVWYLACLGLIHIAHTTKKWLESVMLSTTLRGLLDMVIFCTILNGKMDSWYPKVRSDFNGKPAKSIRNPLTLWRMLSFILTLFVFLLQATAFLVWAKPMDEDRC